MPDYQKYGDRNMKYKQYLGEHRSLLPQHNQQQAKPLMVTIRPFLENTPYWTQAPVFSATFAVQETV